uniref:Uncharacterized protein n=1 Tax=Tetraselmis sp. GSL018 TaxID=582737 RepID=A0A061R795_9CHLO|mmetsp:Transcript_33779/g.80167  ORF Transcript_33779/g.80167 Transcript_33779/m.80167 type:complete len:788 (+) Transcript_33779:211-2574(+)
MADDEAILEMKQEALAGEVDDSLQQAKENKPDEVDAKPEPLRQVDDQSQLADADKTQKQADVEAEAHQDTSRVDSPEDLKESAEYNVSPFPDYAFPNQQVIQYEGGDPITHKLEDREFTSHNSGAAEQNQSAMACDVNNIGESDKYGEEKDVPATEGEDVLVSSANANELRCEDQKHDDEQEAAGRGDPSANVCEPETLQAPDKEDNPSHIHQGVETENASSQDGSPSEKRKRKPRASDDHESPRPPRLSPEPADDPEAAKRVREKNRLRLYRYNRNVEKRQLMARGDASSWPARPTAAEAEAASNAAEGFGAGLIQGAMLSSQDIAKEPQGSPTTAGEGGESPQTASKQRPRSDPPRMSPIPEGATAEEQKRIKAKNRLRLYRWNISQGIKTRQKPVKKRVSSTGFPGSDDAEAPGEGLPDGQRQGDASGQTAASEPSSFAAVAAAAASAQQQGPADAGQMAAHTLSAQSIMDMIRAPRGAGCPEASPSQSPTAKRPRNVPRAVPSGPPRLSPEPEDPKEAKRVRSKNRVRMHRYNQSIMASQQAAAEAAKASLGSVGGLSAAAALQLAQAPLMGQGAQLLARQLGAMQHGGSDPLQDLYRHMLENQTQPHQQPGPPSSQPAACSGGEPPSPWRPVARPAPAPQKRPSETSEQQEAAHDMDRAAKRQRRASESAGPSQSFVASLEELPFQELPPNLRELAFETYVKETMGMASSLHSLETQLRASPSMEGGHMAQQSAALLSAVSQLRSDAWGLSQLRLSQYAASKAGGAEANKTPSRRPSQAGEE